MAFHLLSSIGMGSGKGYYQDVEPQDLVKMDVDMSLVS